MSQPGELPGSTSNADSKQCLTSPEDLRAAVRVLGKVAEILDEL
ncbi:hypothetical protein ABT174_39870 [Streptomyces sparsogenes]